MGSIAEYIEHIFKIISMQIPGPNNIEQTLSLTSDPILCYETRNLLEFV